MHSAIIVRAGAKTEIRTIPMSGFWLGRIKIVRWLALSPLSTRRVRSEPSWPVSFFSARNMPQKVDLGFVLVNDNCIPKPATR